MNRLALCLAAALCAISLWAQEAQLPPTCLFIERGRAQFQGDLKLPAEMLQAEHVALLRALGRGLVLWTVQQRDDTGDLIEFALHIADVTTGGNRQYLKGLDPFGIGTEWYLTRATLTASGRAVLVRVRLAGSGGFINVYKLMLEPPHYWYEMAEDTPVWNSQSADGSVQARPVWELTPDWQAVSTERQARYATVIVAGKSTPEGRKLWTVQSSRAIPDWAQPDIDETAVSPDGKLVAFANPRGLWLAPVRGGEPKLLLPSGAGPVQRYHNLVWNEAGSGLYFTSRHLTDEGAPGLQYLAVNAPGAATIVKPSAENLCLPRL